MEKKYDIFISYRSDAFESTNLLAQIIDSFDKRSGFCYIS